MKIKLYLTLFLFISITLCSKTIAQTPNWLWAKSIGGTSADRAITVATDISGNVYIAGYFNGTVDFDPGAGVNNVTSTGGYDIFICKLNATGNFVWVKHVTGSGNQAINSLSIDNNGNIYATGWFYGTVDFDPAATVYNLNAAGGGNDVFVEKLDSSGNFIWAKAMTGQGLNGDDEGRSVSLDMDGNVYTTGSFHGTIDFDPGATTFKLSSSGTFTTDIFISKLDNSGNFLWAKSMGGLNEDAGNSITTDALGNVYTTGTFQAIVDLNPDTLQVFQVLAYGGDDVFISKLDSTGNFVWALAFQGTSGEVGNCITKDDSNHIYIAGTFQSTVDFDPGAPVVNLTSAGSNDVFITKMDTAGTLLWAKTMGGSGADVGSSLAIDPNGNVYSTGYYSGTADFDPGAGTLNLSSQGIYDIFLSEIDMNGNFVLAKSAGGIKGDIGTGAALDQSGNAFVAGYFYSSAITFGTITLTNADNSGNTYDMFIAKVGNLSAGINELAINDNISIYPNPCSDKISINLPEMNKSINVKITDLTGKVFFEKSEHQKPRIEISTKNLEKGIYVIQLDTEGFSKSEKLVVIR